MKHIIQISELIGKEIRTRLSLEPLKVQLNSNDEYLFDMSNVEMISRSAADELFTITQKYTVSLVHLTTFIQQMMDVVAVGRFTKREHDIQDAKFIKCDSIESFNDELQKING